MKPKTITDIDRQEHEEKMKVWRYNYPLASAMMSGAKPTDAQVMTLVKLGEDRRNNE